MKPVEIVELIKRENPELLGNMREAKAARIIRAALAHIRKEVSTAKEGVVSMPGLGNFKVRNVERMKEGKKVSVRQVVFNAASPKAAAAK